jgi:hypothetical protein
VSPNQDREWMDKLKAGASKKLNASSTTFGNLFSARHFLISRVNQR